jgi:hypothetical protein
MVHRPAELRVRMQDDGDGGVLLAGRMVAAFDSAGGPCEDDFWHWNVLEPVTPAWRRRPLALDLDGAKKAVEINLELF